MQLGISIHPGRNHLHGVWTERGFGTRPTSFAARGAIAGTSPGVV